MAVEPLTDQELQLRDELAWRACLGHLSSEDLAVLDAFFEPLSLEDRATLAALDARLDALDPGSEPLPADVQAIMRDVMASRKQL
jgi:hypothetical protein